MHQSLEASLAEPSRPHLFTVEEFQCRIESHAKGIGIGLAAFIGAMAGLYVVAFVIYFSLAPAHDGAPNPFDLVAFSLFFLGRLLIIFGFSAWGDCFLRRCRIACPHCAKQLEINTDFHFAIAIHGCPHCYNPLFQEWSDHFLIMPPPNDAPPGEGEYTFADLREAASKRNQAIRKRLTVVAILALMVLGFTSAALWAWQGSLTATFGHMAGDVADGIRLIPAFVMLAIGFFWACFNPPGAFPKCAGCGMKLMSIGRCTRITGNCTTCGRRVLCDAPVLRVDDDRSEYPRIEPEQLAKWKARYQRRLICSIFVITGLGTLGWFWLVTWWFEIAWNQPVTLGPMVLTYVGCFILILVLGWVNRLPRQKKCCPHCQSPLVGGADLIQATGNCSHCGRRVMKSAGSIEGIG